MADRRVLIVTRSVVPFPTPEEAATEYASLLRAVMPYQGAIRRILIDVRDAPPNRTTAFESGEVAERRGAITKGFDKVAFVTRTAMGALHTKRLSDHDELSSSRVFTKMSDALAWLTR